MKSLTLPLILLTLSTLTLQDCSQKAIIAVGQNDDAKAREEPLESIPQEATIQTPDETKICGKIWKANGGGCVNQDNFAARMQKRLERAEGNAAALKSRIKDEERFNKFIEKAVKTCNKLKEKAADYVEKAKESNSLLDQTAIGTWADKCLEWVETNLEKYKTIRTKALETLGDCFVERENAKNACDCTATSAGATSVYDELTNTWKVNIETVKTLVEKCGYVNLYNAITNSIASVGVLMRSHAKASVGTSPVVAFDAALITLLQTTAENPATCQADEKCLVEYSNLISLTGRNPAIRADEEQFETAEVVGDNLDDPSKGDVNPRVIPPKGFKKLEKIKEERNDSEKKKEYEEKRKEVEKEAKESVKKFKEDKEKSKDDIIKEIEKDTKEGLVEDWLHKQIRRYKQEFEIMRNIALSRRLCAQTESGMTGEATIISDFKDRVALLKKTLKAKISKAKTRAKAFREEMKKSGGVIPAELANYKQDKVAGEQMERPEEVEKEMESLADSDGKRTPSISGFTAADVNNGADKEYTGTEGPASIKVLRAGLGGTGTTATSCVVTINESRIEMITQLSQTTENGVTFPGDATATDGVTRFSGDCKHKGNKILDIQFDVYTTTKTHLQVTNIARGNEKIDVTKNGSTVVTTMTGKDGEVEKQTIDDSQTTIDVTEDYKEKRRMLMRYLATATSVNGVSQAQPVHSGGVNSSADTGLAVNSVNIDTALAGSTIDENANAPVSFAGVVGVLSMIGGFVFVKLF